MKIRTCSNSFNNFNKKLSKFVDIEFLYYTSQIEVVAIFNLSDKKCVKCKPLQDVLLNDVP